MCVIEQYQQVQDNIAELDSPLRTAWLWVPSPEEILFYSGTICVGHSGEGRGRAGGGALPHLNV